MGSQKKKHSWHPSWSRKRLAEAWSMGKSPHKWDDVIEWCNLNDIYPMEVFNWVAGRKINKTDEKTMKIAELVSSRNSKLPLRAKAIHLRNEIIKIDKNLKRRNDEDDNQWYERIYKRVHNALSRVDKSVGLIRGHLKNKDV